MAVIHNPYRVLGLKEGCSEKDVKKAFRLLCKEYHPDITGAKWGDESYKKFLEIRDAYEMIISGKTSVVSNASNGRSSTDDDWYWSHKSLFQIFKRRK